MDEPVLQQQPTQQPAPAPAQVQQQAPVQQPAPTPAPVAQPTPAPEQTFTGLAGIEQARDTSNLMNTYLMQAGISSEHIAAEMKYNDGKISDVTRNLLIAKHGDNAALIEQLLVANHSNTLANEKALETKAHSRVAELFGLQPEQGSQAMTELVTWSLANMDKEELNQYADLIEAGGVAGDLALKALVDNFKAKYSQQPNTLNGDGGAAQVGGQPLTREEYNRQRFEIEEKHGYNSPQMVELQTRRNAAIAAGY